MLPPVLLFAYQRPIHLARSWQSLAENAEATRTELYVFLDGPKNSKDCAKVLKTRAEARKIQGFKDIHLYAAKSNLGLSKSILNGIKKVSQKASSWIVLEDDLVVGKNFLKLMHDALRCYEKNNKVASIHGYVYPADKVLPETFFLRGASFSLLQMIRTGDPEFRLHLSTAVVFEYEEVLLREFVPGRFRPDEIAKFLDDLVAASTRHAQVKSLRPVSSDPDDDTLIELAITADVQALITHNVRHFSKVPGFGIDLLTPGQLLQKYRV